MAMFHIIEHALYIVSQFKKPKGVLNSNQSPLATLRCATDYVASQGDFVGTQRMPRLKNAFSAFKQTSYKKAAPRRCLNKLVINPQRN
jgi:hypothetical protein